MAAFVLVLVATTLLCALVAGFLFTYAVVVMPGFKVLEDRAYIRAFQVTDGVIQRGQPIFMVVWLGSVLGIMLSALLGLSRLHGVDLVALLLTGLGYLVGVQLPTIFIHLPLNKSLQAVDTELADAEDIARARSRFEDRWNRANGIRTGVAVLATLLLMILLLRF